MDARTLWILGFTLVGWAAAFPAIRIALRAYSPGQLAFFRFAISAGLLLAVALAARLKLPPWRDALRIGGLGVLGIAAYALLLGYGQKQVPAGSASLLISSSPVWMVVIAAALGRERPSARALAGIAVSFSGVALIAGGNGLGFSLGTHSLAVLGAALAGASYNVLQRPLAAKHGALAFTVVAVWGGMLALWPASTGLGDAIQSAPAAATMAVLFLAVVPGALGYVGWSYVLSRTSAASAGSSLYLVPAIAMLLSHVVLGEVPSWLAIAGGALVLAGVITVQRRSAATVRTLPVAQAAPSASLRAAG